MKQYIVRHFPQRINYFTILLYFLIAQMARMDKHIVQFLENGISHGNG